MSLKEDRISEVMKERIAQLEGEVQLYKHHVNEAITHKESLETEIDTLRNEAHQVVSQWEEKCKDLQRNFDELTSRYQSKEIELESHQSRITSLERILNDSETSSAQRLDEIKRMKEESEELKKRATTAESDWCAASQRIMKYESLVNKMDLELKQSVENIRCLTLDKHSFLETITSLGKDKECLELTVSDYKDTVDDLRNKIFFMQNEQRRLALVEEEQTLRVEMLLTAQFSFTHNILKEINHLVVNLSALRNRCREIESIEALLRNEQKNYRNEILALKEKNASLQGECEANNLDFSKQLACLKSRNSELQDAQLNRESLVKSLEERIELANLRCSAIESSKESLEAELKVVKDSYSSLLSEHGDLKEQGEKTQEHLNERIGYLEEERRVMELNLKGRVSTMTAENAKLANEIHNFERNYLQEVESKGRLHMQVELYESIIMSTLHFYAKFSSGACETVMRLRDMQSENGALSSLVTNKSAEINGLNEKLQLAHTVIDEKDSVIGVLESKYSQGAAELEETMKTLAETTNDNNWLKDQVESMRKELGELDELLNANLNDMREENERHQIENAQLTKETLRLEELNKNLQDKISYFEERHEVFSAETAAISKTLSLTEADLERVKEEKRFLKEHEKTIVEKNQALESKIASLQKEHCVIDSQTSVLSEQLRTKEAKLQFVTSASKQEVEMLKNKVNSYIEKFEDSENKLLMLSKSYQELETSFAASQEAYNKAKVTLEEVKQRCCRDSETIKELLMERDGAVKDREVMVEKYNRIHDLLKVTKKESNEDFHEEVHRLSELCTQQELELQHIRHQNIMLKKGIVKISDGSFNHTDRPVFIERLNLTEGPLRHPRKRTATNSETNSS